MLDALCEQPRYVDFRVIAIEEASYAGIFESAWRQALPIADTDLTEENLQARIRGTLLMALSNKFGWLVLTTGNKSETAVGYSTMYGDSAGGYAVIKDVPKTLVYRLCALSQRERAERTDLVLAHGHLGESAISRIAPRSTRRRFASSL